MNSSKSFFWLISPMILITVLSGCLLSTTPYFDETNSLAISESRKMAELYPIECRQFLVPPVYDPNNPDIIVVPAPPPQTVCESSFPFDTFDDSMRVILEEPFLLFQYIHKDTGAAYYFGLRENSDGEELFCDMDTTQLTELEKIAGKYEVTLRVLPLTPEGNFAISSTYPPVQVIGEGENARAFISEAFKEGPVRCEVIHVGQ